MSIFLDIFFDTLLLCSKHARAVDKILKKDIFLFILHAKAKVNLID
jgi:hypothetical protein